MNWNEIWIVLGALTLISFVAVGRGSAMGGNKWSSRRWVANAIVAALLFLAAHDAATLWLMPNRAVAAGPGVRAANARLATQFVRTAAGNIGRTLLPPAGGLPGISVQVSMPATPQPGSGPRPAPKISLEELRSKSLPVIPQEVKSMPAGSLATLGAAEVTTTAEKTVVRVGAVVSPSLSSDRSSVNTRSWSRLIVEGLDPSLTLPVTATVTVQVFRDGTLMVSSKSLTSTVEGWVRDVRLVAEAAHDLDLANKLHSDDPLRTELAQTWGRLRVVLEFSLGITNPGAVFGSSFTGTQRSVDRLQTLPVAAGSYKFNIHQAPRGADEGGTPELQALISALRRQYFELSSRQRALADQIAQSQATLDGPERKALLVDAEGLLWTVRDLKSKLTVEMALGTGYDPVLLQWLNATELDLGNLVRGI